MFSTQYSRASSKYAGRDPHATTQRISGPRTAACVPFSTKDKVPAESDQTVKAGKRVKFIWDRFGIFYIFHFNLFFFRRSTDNIQLYIMYLYNYNANGKKKIIHVT